MGFDHLPQVKTCGKAKQWYSSNVVYYDYGKSSIVTKQDFQSKIVAKKERDKAKLKPYN
jgi:hypothetical protein